MVQQAVISVQNISIGYRKKKQYLSLYDNLSFDLHKGELISLLGSNGAGKSTLLRSIGRLQPLLKGDIYINNKNIQEYSEHSLSKIMGLVLTDKTSTGELTVRELVELGRYPYTGFFGQLTKEDKAIVEKSMKDVGINHKADNYMAELSDGERQKVMIAKVLAQECPIILLDEPTAFLDIESRTEIISLLHTLASQQDKTILLSTHDIDLALLLSDKLFLLSEEKSLQYGVTEDIILSGVLDNFFDDEIIVFDKETGSFIPQHSSDKSEIYVKANSKLYKWTESLLNKNGYAASDKDSCPNKIEVHSPTSIYIKTPDNSLNISSFEELRNWLKHK
jgi:iron complex transport system ATP-binding protein